MTMDKMTEQEAIELLNRNTLEGSKGEGNGIVVLSTIKARQIAALIEWQQQQIEAISSLLPDNYSESKDWKASNTVNRIDWLKEMFENKKSEIAQLEQTIERLKCCGSGKTLAAANAELAAERKKLSELKEQYRELANRLASHGPDGHQYTNQQFIDIQLAKEQAEAQLQFINMEFDHEVERSKRVEARLHRMEGALRELLDSPYVLEEATIPKLGPDRAPEQVVGTLHVGLVKYRKAKAALEEK